MYKHVFLARWTNGATPEFEIDAFMAIQCPEPDPADPETILRHAQGEARISSVSDEELGAIRMMIRRARHEGDLIPGGPFVTSAEEEVSRHTLETLIELMDDERREDFLRESSFRHRT